MKDKTKILAPTGDMTCLQAALDAGADAVRLNLEAKTPDLMSAKRDELLALIRA